MTVAPVPVEAIVRAPESARASHFFRRLLRRKVALVCLAYVAVVIGIGIVAPLVMPQVSHENAGDLLAARQGPSWHHLLGTDTLGRDVLDRLLVGTRVTLIGAAEGLVVALLIGVSFGLAAGYLGGRVDRAICRTADLMFSLPGIIIILVVLSIFPGSLLAAMCTFGVLTSPGSMRIVRSAVLPVKEELYIAAARVSGLSRRYIIGRHILPRVAGPVIVNGSLLAAATVLVQAGLSYLGLVSHAPAPSWGGMLTDGISVLILDPWLIWPAGIAIVLTVMAFGLLGDVVRDVTAESWSSSPAGTSRRRRRAASEQPRSLEPADALLSIEGLSIGFPARDGGSITVVEDVSFSIREGEAVGLVGESGCGKTVTAVSILGLLPGSGTIQSGRILFEGRDLAGLGEKEMRPIRGGEIGFISQEPMISLNPSFRVGPQLAEVVRSHLHLTRAEARLRVLALLRDVHLPDPAGVARRYPHELSGGMAQRVAIARALAGEPKLLIADEPTTALDVTVQAEILDLLRELQVARDMAVLLVTHDWGVVADLCERAVVMYAGQIVEQAELVPMFREPRHPYTEALLAANPHHAPEAAVLPSIPGSVPQPGQWPTGCHFHPRCAYATPTCVDSPVPLERLGSRRETRCIHHDLLASANGR